MYEMENISFQEIESGNRLQQLAVEIITFDRQAKITAVSCAIEIGERLLEAKDLVPHGEWGTWLKENVNYSQSTANNFMRLYKEYGNNQGSLFTTLTNSQTIMNLDVSKALALTVLPPEEREEFVAEHDVEQMSTRDLKEALQENRELKQQQQQLQKQLEENQKHFVNEVRFNDKETDLSMCMRHIQKAKEKGADIIIATIHWGWEFEMYPHKKTVDIAHQLIEAGVDVILGGHPHVAEPMEKYTYQDREGRTRQGLVIYSLGDFVTYHPLSKDSKLTFVVRFEVVKGMLEGQERTLITDFKMMPVYIMAEEKEDGTYDCRLLKFYNILNDKPVNGKYKYNLDPQMRKDLPRLEKLLYKIVLPKKYQEVLYTGCEKKA